MRKKTKKVNPINNIIGTVIGIEMELSLLEQDLEALDVDLYYLDSVHNDLLYNLDILKQEGIISVVSAYKLSLDQLKDVKDRIIEFKNLKRDVQERIEAKLKSKNYYFTQFNRNYKESANDNIIVLKFNKDKHEDGN